MAPHRIHLRGPWEVTGPWSHGDTNPHRSVTLPVAWQALFGTQAGTATFHRWFNRPTNLTSADRLTMVLTGVRGTGSARLNDGPWVPLVLDGTQAEIPLRLSLFQPRNRFEVELTFDPTTTVEVGGLFDAVALEIDSPNDAIHFQQ
jgi:hypothetical protein